MKCPACATESTGAFCPRCGVPLEGATCDICDASLQAGAAFCTQCGAPVRDGPSPFPWIIAGTAIVAVIVLLAVPTIRRGGNADEQAFATAPFANDGEATGAPPPLTGTPREQADRLFNRIMQEREQGNDERAKFFLPMAITAYQQAGELDGDGLYHLSLLQSAASRFTEARATAERALATSPNHLLALAAAAEAALAAGDTTAAREFYQRFLEHFDQESVRDLPEYRDHGRVLPEYRKAAEALLSGSTG